ncbi:potassium channel family protein [Sphingomonas sp. H39-1-10]|uniref:potassium channel family protein n=1 Tax=Sphingomonas pollutisoli TaxID=3030829 RepID=UPI0023B8DA51|nr:potassium channel family protein [Sphingomonas pollutisoli]MDF0487549.1 potassium channel family protein [Sphingomonas pollutisoli]
MSLVCQLLVATAMVLSMLILHLGGLALLISVLAHRARVPAERHWRVEVAVIVAAAIGLFVLHGIEIWAYALLYDGTGAVPDFETALYFSTATYTTIGYGDVLLARPWRLIGAIEGANGIILLGWSTAFFVAMVRRIGFVERQLGL